MHQPTPIPPLTDELIARLQQRLVGSTSLGEGVQFTAVPCADLTTVLHHLEAYRDAVERWEKAQQKRFSVEFVDARRNLSAVHARAKGTQ